MISPALSNRRDEAALIGLLVLGYSELDIMFCHVGGLALGNKSVVMDALHKIQNEGTRIDVVSRLVRHVFSTPEKSAQFGETLGAIKFCKTVRNQYAHAKWGDDGNGLIFFNAHDANWLNADPFAWKATNLALLKEQEAYFEYTRKCLLALEWELSYPNDSRTFPPHMQQPKKHNLP